MSKGEISQFQEEREQLNEIVMEYANLGIKRFFNLDTQAYQAGALPKRMKELLGLVASLVLRCDDCIKYHIIRCYEEGITDAEIEEALSIGLIVGGSITIPHLRRALQAWDELKQDKAVLFKYLTDKVKDIVDGKTARDEKLQTVCELLSDRVAYYDWVGFYIADAETREFSLGAFAGEPTEHTNIPFGAGICGQVANSQETFIVQDVSKETNYLACSLKVKSEIVVPIFKGDAFVAELDIDSHTTAPFTPEDSEFLERVCNIVSKLF